jgi:ribonucleoside-diphosphate reductase alpha chain
MGIEDSMTLDELKQVGEAPEFLQEEGYKTLCGGYLLPDETPKAMYQRVAKAAASYYSNSAYWEEQFFDVLWKNWLCPATPVLSNMGTTRGLPISCNSIHVDDSIDSIFMKNHELAMLSKNGAGVGIYMGDIRGRGKAINGNGASEGIIPWCKVYDVTTNAVSQGSTRRGASAVYLPIDHLDVDEFLNIRRPTGDVNRRCLNLNHGICVSDEWMKDLIAGNQKKRLIWQEVLKLRIETGEPYLFFTDNVNRVNPECYRANKLTVKTSNICTEIFLHTDPEHSFVCCLSSLNLTKWQDWKDSNLPAIATRFLDAVIEEYIRKTKDMPGLQASRNSAIKGRAIGIGVLGWHTLLQNNMIPFDSFDAMMLNSQIFRTIREKAEEETKKMAIELGEPEWCKGFGRRNTHLMAIAPTVSNSTISGGQSAGIEPISANIYSQKSAKGTFIRKNPALERLLEMKGANTPQTWKSINERSGSVMHLDCLNNEEKSVFLTAREINQHAIIKQAAQRQAFIDQGQSVNLFFGVNSDPKYIHEVHLAAWEGGLKSLYYCRTEGVIRGDLASRSKDECAACEG